MTFAEQSFTYPMFSGNHIDFTYLSNVADTLLAEGANTVQVDPFLTQATATSSEIITSSDTANTLENYFNPPTDAELQQVISAFTAKGLNVELKVSIQPQDNSWSGILAPTDVDQWFAGYTAAVVDYAKVAQSEGIKKLIITNELQSMTTNPAYRDQWLAVIAAVRAVYSGEIGVNATAPYEVENLTFADQLDFVGVSLYPTLTTDTTPTPAELSADWTHDANGNDWVSIFNNLHTQYNKPIEVSEVAFESRLGAASQGNQGNLPGPADQSAQVNEYQSFLNVFSQLPSSWFLGVSFWQAAESSPDSWPASNDPGTYGPSGTIVVGKPAEAVVSAWFGGEDIVPSSANSYTGTANDDNICLYGDEAGVGVKTSQSDRAASFSTTISFTLNGTIINGQLPVIHVWVNGIDFGATTLTDAPSTYIDSHGVNWTQWQTVEVTLPGLITLSQLQVDFDGAVDEGGPENSQTSFRSVAVNGVELPSATYFPLSGGTRQQTIAIDGNAGQWDGGYTIMDTSGWNADLPGLLTIGTPANPITVDGGGGSDTVHVLGAPADYDIAENNDASWSVQEHAGLNQNAILSGVSYLDFADGGQLRLACFASGTRIGTVQGDVSVEDLHVGTKVKCAGGGVRRAVWIGRRDVDCQRHPHPTDVLPVRVLAGALGAGMPIRDLRLSPDHAVAIDDVLIPIRYLVNGTTIVQEAVDAVTYWHIELPRHDVILAEGLPCESYLDTGNRGAFANGGWAVPMHPDFSSFKWDVEGCAPLIVTGPKLEAARQLVSASQ